MKKSEVVNKKNNEVKKLRMRKKAKNLALSIFLFVAVMSMAVTGIVIGYNDEKTKFTRDVYINGSDVRGYTVEKANQVIAEKMEKSIEDMDIKVVYGDKIWQFDKNDFEIDDAVKNVVNTAFRTSKFTNKDAVNLVASKTGSFKTGINEVIKNFDEKIDNIVSEIEVEPVDASVEFHPNQKQMFKICDAENGIEVDKDRLIDDLKCQFLKNQNITVYVHTKSIAPKINSDYFADKLSLQSKFTTSIKDSQAGRRNNVTVALEKINGTVVKPNEIVSFNKLTSPQDASGGYKDAIIILNGKYANGIGGGLCQASTTLYNACVLANMEILEVHKHTIPVHYVEHALDAMISDGYADMIFKNNSENNIYIKSYVSGDDATVEIYGKSVPDGITIKRVSEEVAVIPHEGDKVIVDTNGEYADKVLYKGEYYRLKWPSEGYEAKAYKEYYKDGELIKKEEIRHEKYQSQQGIVVEGAQELPEGFVLPEQNVTIYKPQIEQ